MIPRQQGDLGELSAMDWLSFNGYDVFVPLTHSPDIDLVAAPIDGSPLLGVQVKTSGFFRKDRWSISVCTRGGNQSWNGIVKRFAATRCDRLFVLVADGRRWFIPSAEICGGTAINLGGPTYAKYEIESGRPFERTPRTTLQGLAAG